MTLLRRIVIMGFTVTETLARKNRISFGLLRGFSGCEAAGWYWY
jgi:hypothetical protein